MTASNLLVKAHRARKGYFNAGVLVIQPSRKTFDNLIDLAKRKSSNRETMFNALVDCTEQALLNMYFNFTINSEGKSNSLKFLSKLVLISFNSGRENHTAICRARWSDSPLCRITSLSEALATPL